MFKKSCAVIFIPHLFTDIYSVKWEDSMTIILLILYMKSSRSSTPISFISDIKLRYAQIKTPQFH